MTVPKNQTPKQRLRKQPRMRRVYSAGSATMPHLAMPKEVRKRKQRNTRQKYSRPLTGLRGFVLNARWISLALVVLGVYGLYMIGGDERFYLNYIPVEGAGTIQATTVVEASGLAGKHIFAADPQEAAERISALPGVITTTVTLQWPNEIMLRIREQPPLAIWQEGETAFWIDENGGLTPARAETLGLLTIISEVPETSSVSNSLLANEQSGNLTSAGEMQTKGNEAATDIDEENPDQTTGARAAFVPKPVLMGALQLRQLRPNIDKLYYRPPGGLSYQDGRGWRAYFGSGEDMDQKLVVYETVVAELLAQGLQPEYISVSNQHKPFYRLAP